MLQKITKLNVYVTIKIVILKKTSLNLNFSGKNVKNKYQTYMGHSSVYIHYYRICSSFHPSIIYHIKVIIEREMR
jgi:hypothetical protein